MKGILVFLVILSTVMSDPIKYYESILDAVDVETVIADKDKLSKYTDCFLDREECIDNISKKIKEIMPEAMATACARCTEKQKHNSRRYFEEIAAHSPQDVGSFQKKYDPEAKYLVNFFLAIKDA